MTGPVSPVGAAVVAFRPAVAEADFAAPALEALVWLPLGAARPQAAADRETMASARSVAARLEGIRNSLGLAWARDVRRRTRLRPYGAVDAAVNRVDRRRAP